MASAEGRLVRLLAGQGIELAEGQVAQLIWLAQELVRWNRRRNLTAISELDEVFEKHIVDSLTLLPYARQSRRMLDIGSGAGFPVLPLKIACPQLEAVSIDAVAKKLSFQKHAARVLGLDRFAALHGRLGALPDPLASAGVFDLVTARAVGKLSLLTKLAAPCLSPGGYLIAMKGPEGVVELQEWREQLESEGWKARCETLRLVESQARRSLLILNR